MGRPIHVATDGPVAIIEIDNPPLNLLTMEVRASLTAAAEAIGADPSVRAVVLRGAGDRAFSAGSDIREFPRTVGDGRARAVLEHACYDAIAGLPQPVVAALNGHVLGGGLELALACDLRVADEQTRLGLPEITLGLFPSGGGTQRLPRTIAPARAKRMMWLAEVVDAAEAVEIGLVDEVTGVGCSAAAALRLAHRIAQQPACAVRAIKQAVEGGLELGRRAGQALEVELVGELFASHDAQEGVRAFLGSRPPSFIHA
jgi:enoyl-CoA hydratase/carnithine racemase